MLKNKRQSFSRLTSRLASRETPIASSSRSFREFIQKLSRLTHNSLTTHENFRNSSRDSPNAQRKSRVHPEAFASHSRLTCDSRKFSQLISRLASHETPVASSSRSFPDSSRDSLVTRPVAKCPETAFLRAFRGKLVLNLSHPLLNISFNIFTSKPNQIEWFFHFLTSLR